MNSEVVKGGKKVVDDRSIDLEIALVVTGTTGWIGDDI